MLMPIRVISNTFCNIGLSGLTYSLSYCVMEKLSYIVLIYSEILYIYNRYSGRLDHLDQHTNTREEVRS